MGIFLTFTIRGRPNAYYKECSTKLSTETAIFFVFEKLKAARIEWQEKFEVFRVHRKENALIEKMADINFWLN